MVFSKLFAALVFFAALPISGLQAEDLVTYEITLKGNAFTVPELKVPANKEFIIKLTNANAAPAELEAKDLKIEKPVAGSATIVVRAKAMPPGKYLFVDEYQEEAAKGYIVVE